MKRWVYLFLLSSFLAAETFAANPPIDITQTAPLAFPELILGAQPSYIVTPASANAAMLKATGKKNASVSYSMSTTSLDLIPDSGGGATHKVYVDTFVITGGPYFDGQNPAQINNIRVGATIHVATGAPDDSYSGTAIMLMTYL